MKLIIVTIIFAGLLGSACLAEETPGLKDEKELISYSVGYQIGRDFKQQEVAINPEAIVKGIRDALSGAKPLMTSEEQRASLVNLQRKVDEQQKEDADERNKE
jgi:FKBP-type peptidyl-prolyl cis-trans isomerase FklB